MTSRIEGLCPSFSLPADALPIPEGFEQGRKQETK